MIQPKIQTVYLPDRKDDCFETEHIQDIDGDFYLKESLITFTREEFETFKQQFGKELLEKAADNANGDIVDDTNYSNGRVVVNKESITSVLDDYLLNNKI